MSTSSTSRLSRSTQVAFGVIIVFLVAQVAWWLWFQADYITEVMSQREAAWLDDAELANLLIGNDAGLADELLAAHPHLLLVAGRFVVDSSHLADFRADQRGHLRMFQFEGAFFVLVVLTGLWVLARSLLVARGLEQRQRNFLLAVTHEFRTPLSTLRLLIETLQYRTPAPEKLNDYLDRIGSELTRLEQSSDRVLASARLEQVESSDDLRATDLNSAVREVITRHRAGLETRKAVVEVAYHPEPLIVDLEPAAFETALTNLFDNAVKFTRGGNKVIRVSVVGDGAHAVLTVADEGVGVGPEEAQRIFDRFYRPGSEMTRNSQGVGLGLHLVRSIVEFLGGKVRHEPNTAAGRGSLFIITLPLARAQQAPLNPVSQQSQTRDPRAAERLDGDVGTADVGSSKA